MPMTLKKISLQIIIGVILLSTLPHPVYATKLRVQKNVPAVKKGVTAGVAFSSAKLSPASRSVVVTFTNLDKVNKISYILNYVGSGNSQGVGGTIIPSGATDKRDFYFGTCSKGVCTPHYTIRNASLTVTATLKSGGIRTKRYILRPKW